MSEILEGTIMGWQVLRTKDERPYEITGKYLFFSEDRNRLLEIARNEILQHGFHAPK